MEFVVTIGRDASSFRVDSDSDEGQGTARFQFPIAGDEFNRFSRCRQLRRMLVRGVRSPEIEVGLPADNGPAVSYDEPLQMAERIGGRLFDSVFAGEVYGLFHTCWINAQKSNADFVTKIVMRDGDDIEALPWEFLYATPFRRFLALSYKAPIVRYMPMPQPPRSLKVSYPLRVLVVIAADPESQLLEAQGEWLDIGRMLNPLKRMRRLNLHRLNNPTRQELDDYLSDNPCHILHFIGHGVVAEDTGESLLLLRDEASDIDKVPSRELGALLANYSSLRLVVLNCCFGATVASPGRHQGLAQSIAAAGIPAVLGMNDEITDVAARRFSTAFYKAVADRRPVEVAAARARLAVFNHDAKALEWGTPVLYMRSPDGNLFDLLKSRLKWLWAAVFLVSIMIISYLFLPLVENMVNELISPKAIISPNDLYAADMSETSCFFGWADQGYTADSFLVEIWENGSIQNVIKARSDVNEIKLEALEPGTCYSLHVRSVIGGKMSSVAVLPGVCTAKLKEPRLTITGQSDDEIRFLLSGLPIDQSEIIILGFSEQDRQWSELTPSFVTNHKDTVISVPRFKDLNLYRADVSGPFGTVSSSNVGSRAGGESTQPESHPSSTPIIVEGRPRLTVDVTPQANSTLKIDNVERRIGVGISLNKGQHTLEIIHPDFPKIREPINLQVDKIRAYSLEEKFANSSHIDLIIGRARKFKDATIQIILNGRNRQPTHTPHGVLKITILEGIWDIGFSAVGSDGEPIEIDYFETFSRSRENPHLQRRFDRNVEEIDFSRSKWDDLSEIKITVF